MSIVSFRDLVFDVDIEATKRHYQKFSVVDPDGKPYRNFKKNFEMITDEEMQFFRSFGIDPLCFNAKIDYGWHNAMSVSGHYIFFGKCVKKEGTDFAVKNTLPENIRVISVNFGYEVGRFIFDFPEIDTPWPETIPDDISKSCVCVEARITNLPWLLSKKRRIRRQIIFGRN